MILVRWWCMSAPILGEEPGVRAQHRRYHEKGTARQLSTGRAAATLASGSAAASLGLAVRSASACTISCTRKCGRRKTLVPAAASKSIPPAEGSQGAPSTQPGSQRAASGSKTSVRAHRCSPLEAVSSWTGQPQHARHQYSALHIPAPTAAKGISKRTLHPGPNPPPGPAMGDHQPQGQAGHAAGP